MDCRVAPHQKHFAFHRLQHFYLWALYGMLPLKWQLYDDFKNFITGRVGGHRFKRPKGIDLAIFVVGKVVFFTLALVIPTLVLHSFWQAFACYAAVSWLQGFALSAVASYFKCRIATKSRRFPCRAKIRAGWKRLGPCIRFRQPPTMPAAIA